MNPLVVAPGEKIGSMQLRPNDNSLVDGSRTVTLQMGNPTRGVLVGANTSTVTLLDDEKAEVSFLRSSETVGESARRVDVTVLLSRACATDVTVPLIVSGSATGHMVDGRFSPDYTVSPTTITIPGTDHSASGVILSASISIYVNDDTVLEDTETVMLTLGAPAPSYVTASATPFTVRINDNDFPPPPPPPPPPPNEPAAPPHPAPYQAPYVPPAPGSLAIDASAIGTVLGTASSGTTSIGPIAPGALCIGEGLGGAVAGATAFFDANKNGIRDFLDLDNDGAQDGDEPNEPWCLTADNGLWGLTISEEFDRNGDGSIDTSEGQFVVIGGTDTALGVPLGAPLIAPVGVYAVSALSTLMAGLVNHHGLSVVDAESRVEQAFGLPQTDLTTLRVVQETAAGNADAAAVYVALAKV